MKHHRGLDMSVDIQSEAVRKIAVFGREFTMPRSRRMRIAIGTLLVILGLFGFLPVLGFWMIPLGFLVLSYEFARVRRWRRRSVLWWERRRRPRP
jgi:purine-cytosine permease-like protein